MHLSTFYVYFPLCFIFDTIFVVFIPSSISMCTLDDIFLNSKPLRSSILTPSVWVCHPHPPCSFSIIVDPEAGV